MTQIRKEFKINRMKKFRNLGKFWAKAALSELEPTEFPLYLDSRIVELHLLIVQKNIEAVYEWFRREFPSQLEYLPKDQAYAFFKGVEQIYQEDEIDWRTSFN